MIKKCSLTARLRVSHVGDGENCLSGQKIVDVKLNEPLQIIRTSENCQVNSSPLINLGYKFLSLPSPPLHIKLSKIQPCPWLHTYIYIYISISNNIYLIKRHNYVAFFSANWNKIYCERKKCVWQVYIQNSWKTKKTKKMCHDHV